MIIVLNKLQVPIGHGPHLEKAFGRASGGLSSFPGFMGLEIWRNPQATEYLVSTKWASREAYQTWRESPAFAAAHRDTHPGVTSAVAVYESVET